MNTYSNSHRPLILECQENRSINENNLSGLLAPQTCGITMCAAHAYKKLKNGQQIIVFKGIVRCAMYGVTAEV
jgi:hypothetical protein